MTITVTTAFTTVDEKDRFKVGPSGCFGYFNSLGYLNLSDGTRANEWTANFDVLEFWPHMQVGNIDQYAKKIEKAVDMMNGLGPYKDLFTVSSCNGIQANARQNPVDRIFTGFMSIRDFMYYPRGFVFLENHQEEYEGKLKALRIAFILDLMGASKDMFGNVTFGSRSSTSESTATFVGDSMDALGIFLMLYGTHEQCSDAWAQNPIGEGVNTSGYVRNGRSELSTIRRERGYGGGIYDSMSHWLRAWIATDNHLSADLVAKKGRLTVAQLNERIRARLQGLRTEAEQASVIFELFDELKDMYE